MKTKVINESEIFGDVVFADNIKFTAKEVIVHGKIRAGGYIHVDGNIDAVGGAKDMWEKMNNCCEHKWCCEYNDGDGDVYGVWFCRKLDIEASEGECCFVNCPLRGKK